jgi:hypothetical protein
MGIRSGFVKRLAVSGDLPSFGKPNSDKISITADYSLSTFKAVGTSN